MYGSGTLDKPEPVLTAKVQNPQPKGVTASYVTGALRKVTRLESVKTRNAA